MLICLDQPWRVLFKIKHHRFPMQTQGVYTLNVNIKEWTLLPLCPVSPFSPGAPVAPWNIFKFHVQKIIFLKNNCTFSVSGKMRNITLLHIKCVYAWYNFKKNNCTELQND